MRRSLPPATPDHPLMLCALCRSVPPQLRRHPRGPLAAAGRCTPLRALVCERCGAPAPPQRPRSLAETALRLERAGLGRRGPLLCGRPSRAA